MAEFPSYLIVPLIIALAGCQQQPTAHGDLCQRTFTPYINLVSGQVRTVHNAGYLEAMDHYGRQEYDAAERMLVEYVSGKAPMKSAYLYLAVCQLAIGKPYDAELSIDRLESSNLKDFKDPCEWYTVLSWLCSDQLDRAREGARRIADAPRHSYKTQAADLVKALEAGR
ncbi:MAG: hypothetical protein QY325_05955 [Flavobacteriales bacterium]|jgi:hypothetical protein|nr:MAG: hypothetical protein QY325_05955 [Flavobacteriales bacterium]